MRGPVGVLMVLALCGLSVGCGDDGDGGSGDGPQDGGSSETVSTSSWVSAADDACAKAYGEIEAPSAAVTGPTTADELSDAESWLGSTTATLEGLVEELDDMAQPSDADAADEANGVVDALGKALSALRATRQAAADGDVGAYGTAFTTYTDDLAAYAQAASTAGLTECAKTP